MSFLVPNVTDIHDVSSMWGGEWDHVIASDPIPLLVGELSCLLSIYPDVCPFLYQLFTVAVIHLWVISVSGGINNCLSYG